MIAIVWVLLAAVYYAAAVVVVALAIGLYRKRGLLVVCAGLPILAALVYATKFVPILDVLVFVPIVVFPAALWNALTQQ